MAELSHTPLRDGDIIWLGQYIPKYSLQHWDSSWSQIILKAKRGDRWIISVLAQILAYHIEQWLPLETDHVLTSVPGKLPDALATKVMSCLSESRILRNERLLIHRRKRMSQHCCGSVSGRIRNVSSSYSVLNPYRVQNTSIVLIDDIITSGATMAECCRLLKRAGARSVAGIALARTVRRTS